MHKDNNNSKTTPYFIKDGGYFENNKEFIGVTEDDDEIYVPTTLIVLTNTEFIDYIKTLTIKNIDGVELTLSEKQTLAENWLRDKGFML